MKRASFVGNDREPGRIRPSGSGRVTTTRSWDLDLPDRPREGNLEKSPYAEFKRRCPAMVIWSRVVRWKRPWASREAGDRAGGIARRISTRSGSRLLPNRILGEERARTSGDCDMAAA